MPSGPDHFARFGLPRGYGVDLKALEDAYQRLSFQYHPDLLATAPAEERAAAQQASAQVNEAYRVLKSSSERAAYLLGLLADGRSLNTETLPDGFLQAMFMLQEEIEELGEAPSPRKTGLREDIQSRVDQVVGDRVALFDAALGSATPEALQAIQSNLNEERYLRRLLERL